MLMYLSKVKLSWEQAKNPYEQHRALWRLFPGCDDQSREFLFRIEQLIKGQGAAVIMQSLQMPEASEIVELMAMRELTLNLQAGQRVRFRLRANPIKNLKDETKGTVARKGNLYTRTVRVPLIHEEQQQAWLERKLAGVAIIESLAIQPELVLNFRKPKEQRSGKVQPVLFEGIASIQDPQALLTLLAKGIGPAKSFGCGLLSLASA
jgi:CRISPR system Cascade subunit CasE